MQISPFILEKYDVADMLTCIIVFILTGLTSFLKPKDRFIPQNDPKSSYPLHGHEMVPNFLVALLTVPLPLAFIVLLYLLQPKQPKHLRKFDLWRTIWAFGNNMAVTLFCVGIMKNLIGRPRPDLFAQINDTSCGKSNCFVGKAVKDAYRSLPSGHSASSLAGFLFVALFLSECLKTKKAAAACVASMFVYFALFIAASRIVDFRHHDDDVVAGALVGVIITVLIWEKAKVRCFEGPNLTTIPSEDVLGDIIL